MSKINSRRPILVLLGGLWWRGSVPEWRVRVRGGVRRPHALPYEVRGARGGSFFWRLRPPLARGASRVLYGPSILARQPYSWCSSRPDCGSGSSGGVESLYAPFLDPRGHQRACTGKRPVSRGEAPSAFNSGGDEASFTSGVPHHTPPDLAISAPLLSHTPTLVGSLVKGGVKGRGDDDDKGARQPLVTIHGYFINTENVQCFAQYLSHTILCRNSA